MKIVRYLAAPLAVVFALVLSGCPSQTVHTDYAHNVNFSNFHSYSWGSVKTSNPLYVQRIKDAVNPDLQAKGWQLDPSGGDVTITAVGSSHDQQTYQTFYSGLGGEGYYYDGFGGLGRTATTTVQTYRVGTLVLDMYDAKTKHLVWRSTAKGDISNNPSNNTQRFDKAIDQMLKNFRRSSSRVCSLAHIEGRSWDAIDVGFGHNCWGLEDVQTEALLQEVIT